jgi:hypothetical protein
MLLTMMRSARSNRPWTLPVLLALICAACGAPDAGEPRAQPAQAPVSPAPAQPHRNPDLPLHPERVDHVIIDPQPRCGPAIDDPKQPSESDWAATPAMQQSLMRLDQALEGVRSFSLGTALDHAQQRAMVVFYPDFHDYARVRSRLVGRVAPLVVVLQPSCHSRQVLDDANRVLLDRGWHPKAREVGMGFWLDPSFSGYRVTVADAEVAESLRKRLGELVRVAVGKAGRN